MEKSKIAYMGLEPYNSRYTLQLTKWAVPAFTRNGFDVQVIGGKTIDTSLDIGVGRVLDAHGRSFYALTQMAELVQRLRNGEFMHGDHIYFEDAFTPGIESLFYIIDQIPVMERPQIWVRFLAQTIDPDDFVWDVGMEDWMRKYEQMIAARCNLLLSNEEMVAHARIAGLPANNMYNIGGLAFDKEEVRNWVPGRLPFNKRSHRVVFSSRFDAEKQPHFFMDLAERMGAQAEFAVLSGKRLDSNDPTALARARKMQEEGKLVIYESLTKQEYYNYLADSRVLFNCALQDWTSNTVSEADALGTNVLFPAYRSFPEIFANDHSRLYIPWSLDDAEAKLRRLMYIESANMGKISDWTTATMDRICDIMRYDSHRRNGIFYRSHVAESKYELDPCPLRDAASVITCNH